jgi:hypothetical protein
METMSTNLTNMPRHVGRREDGRHRPRFSVFSAERGVDHAGALGE